MEETHTTYQYRRPYLSLKALMDFLPIAKQDEVALKIMENFKSYCDPDSDKKPKKKNDKPPRYSRTVNNAVMKYRGPCVASFFLDNRLELPDDIDFSRPSGTSRENEF